MDSQPGFKARLWIVLWSIRDACHELCNEEEALGTTFFPISKSPNEGLLPSKGANYIQ